MPSINLIAPELRQARLQSQRVRWWTISALVAGLVSSWPVGRELSAQYQITAQRNAMKSADESLEKTKLQSEDSAEKLVALRQEIARAERLRFKRSWSSLISVVSMTLPSGAWMTVFSTDPAKPQVQAAAMSPFSAPRLTAGKDADEPVKEPALFDYSTLIGKSGPGKIVIEGQALGIEEIFMFVAAIDELRVFKNATLKSVKEATLEGQPVNVFTMECEW